MCEPTTVGLIITALSGTAEAVNQNQAFRAQDRAAAEGITRQGNIQSGASKRVGEQIEDIAGSDGSAERGESLEGFLDAIRASKTATEGSLNPITTANPRFAERVSGGKARIATQGAKQAGRLSRIDAPLFQRQAEGDRIGRTAGDLNEFSRQSSMEDFLTRLRVAGKRPNELISLLSQIGKGVGSVLALRPPTPAEAASSGGIFGGGGSLSGGGFGGVR